MIYKSRLYGRNKFEPADKSWFSWCCGARYSPNVTSRTNFQAGHLGIRVFEGIVGEEYVGPKQQLKHIKTRNGDLTVSIRHEY